MTSSMTRVQSLGLLCRPFLTSILVEEDIFASDFESTDEEAEKIGEVGENEIIDEERRIRKVSVPRRLFI